MIENPLENIKVVILAGGLGSRLSELTNKIPKPILHICKAIPCSSNSTPIPNFSIILQPVLTGIHVPRRDYLLY